MASSFYSFLQVGPRRSIWQKTEWEKITWPAPTSITFVVSVDLATFATNDDNAAICKWIAALEKNKNNYPIKEILLLPLIITFNLLNKNPCQVRQKKRDCKINVIVVFPTKRSCLVPMSDASPTAWISDCVPTSWRFLALIPWASTLPMGAANISERATWKIIHQWSGRVADHETNPGTLNCGRHTPDSMYYYSMCKHQNCCQGSQALQSMEDEMLDLIFNSPASLAEERNKMEIWES